MHRDNSNSDWCIRSGGIVRCSNGRLSKSKCGQLQLGPALIGAKAGLAVILGSQSHAFYHILIIVCESWTMYALPLEESVTRNCAVQSTVEIDLSMEASCFSVHPLSTAVNVGICLEIEHAGVAPSHLGAKLKSLLLVYYHHSTPLML